MLITLIVAGAASLLWFLRSDQIQPTPDINVYKLISSWAEEIKILADAELHLPRPFQ